MWIKKTIHYLLIICAFGCLLMAMLTMINAFLKILPQPLMKIITIINVFWGIIFITILIISLIFWKINFSSFDSNLQISKWKCYVIFFQILLFFINGVLHRFNFQVGQSFYLITLSHFFWVADIGYLFPLINK